LGIKWIVSQIAPICANRTAAAFGGLDRRPSRLHVKCVNVRGGPITAGDLYKFAGVLSGKLKNTLGLFISINGFSPECTATRSEALKAMILMHGADLNAILDDRITLPEMLYRKRRHASQTGNIYLPVDKILG